MNKALDIKLRLFSKGIDPDSPAIRAIIHQGGHISIAEMAANGLDLYLYNQVLCNGPLRAGGLRLEPTTEGVSIQDDDMILGEAIVIPRPTYSTNRDILREIERDACLTVDRISSWLVHGCRFAYPKDACRFCELPLHSDYSLGDAERMAAAVKTILDLEKTLQVHHLQVTGGTPRPHDEERLLNAINHLACTGLPVQWMAAPPTSLDLIIRAKEAGASEIAISLELFNESARKRFMPGKSRISKEHYGKALKEAVRVFGRGRVRSLLMVGIEPTEDTISAVTWLSSLGVIPVLSPFRPLAGTPLAAYPYPSYDTLLRTLEDATHAASDHDMRLGTRCVRCQYDVLAPAPDTDWYENPVTASEVATWREAWQEMTTSPVC